MFAVGLLYLVSEGSIIKPAKVSKDDLAKVANDGFSRTILGAQVCLRRCHIRIMHIH